MASGLDMVLCLPLGKYLRETAFHQGANKNRWFNKCNFDGAG